MRSHLLARSVALVTLVAHLASAQERLDDYAKDVAAPPFDVQNGLVVLPEPQALGSTSRATFRALAPRSVAGRGWVVETTVAVDADGALALALLTERFADWSWQLVDPAGVAVDVAHAHTRDERVEGTPGWSGDRVEIAHARAGTWRLAARAPANDAATPPATWLLARTAGAARLHVHASTLATRSDVEVAIVARLDDAGVATIERASAALELASGPAQIALADDGLHGDGAARDGVFGAWLPRGTSGAVRARVDAEGLTRAGAPFARSAHLAFPVIERRTALTGLANVAWERATTESPRLRIELDALALGPLAKLQLSAEVWGTARDGELVPVCWLSRMQEPEQRAGAWTLHLALDRRWIDRADAAEPFVLRRVRVQDPDTHVPHDLVDEIALAMPPIAPRASRAPIPVTQAMLQGPLASGPHAPANPTLLTPALMLVHGYCSGGSIWPAAHFSQPKIEFQDPDANRTHDQFALMLRQAGSARTSFGVVAHSQGGQAALHLYTYYASGLDAATGPRRIQSVASPYQGTPLASLGSFACGVNDDMTTSGAPVWLAGIPGWARAQVFYWTTQNSGSTCSFLTGWLLDNPEDGTTEMWRGQLVGANSMGHLNGWCHTTGMSSPASYTDAVRNAERDAQAAR